ncbi:MAG: recombinase family protein [Cellulomonas sp.]
MDAVIYTRISSDREGTEIGVDRQLADCRALAAREGLTVVGEYVENDVSASTRSRKARPMYLEMLQRARAHEFGVIVAYSNSRVTRRPRETEDLIELFTSHGTRTHTVVSGRDDLSTADGRMVARIKGDVDAGEAERIAERVTRAKVQAAAEGRYRGGRRPFGYEADGVTLRPTEAHALHRAAEGVLAGRSMLALAREMDAAGVTTTGGKPMSGVAVLRILQRPRNAGLMEVGGKITGKAAWPAILTEDLWRAVVAILADPSRRTTPGNARRWLGSGLYSCGVCGASLHSHRSPKARWSYVCSNGKHVARDQEALDGLVIRTVVERLSAPDVADLLEVTEDLEPVRHEVYLVRARLDGLARLFAADGIDADQFGIASVPLRARLEAAEARLAQSYRRSPLGAVASQGDPASAFLASPLDVQQAVIHALMTVTVNVGRKGRPAGWRPGQPYADLASVQIQWLGAADDAEGLAAAG